MDLHLHVQCKNMSPLRQFSDIRRHTLDSFWCRHALQHLRDDVSIDHGVEVLYDRRRVTRKKDDIANKGHEVRCVKFCRGERFLHPFRCGVGLADMIRPLDYCLSCYWVL